MSVVLLVLTGCSGAGRPPALPLTGSNSPVVPSSTPSFFHRASIDSRSARTVRPNIGPGLFLGPISFQFEDPYAQDIVTWASQNTYFNNAFPNLPHDVTGVQANWNANLTQTFGSVASLQTAISNNGIAPNASVLVYILGTGSPQSEQQQWAASMQNFCSLAHGAGKACMTSPSPDIFSSGGGNVYTQYLNSGVPAAAAEYADFYNIQAQEIETTNPSEYVSFVNSAASAAAAVKHTQGMNYSFAELAVNPPPSQGTPTKAGLEQLIASTYGQLNVGYGAYWIIDQPPSQCPTCTPKNDALAEQIVQDENTLHQPPRVKLGFQDAPESGPTKGWSLATIESYVGGSTYHFDYHLQYDAWTDMATKGYFPTGSEIDDAQVGRESIVGLGCDPNQADLAGSNPNYTDVDTIAAAFKSYYTRFGKQLLVRYCREMNRIDNGNPVGGPPAQFIAAWKNLYNRMKSDGVTNVAWYFCASGGDASTIGNYYPGDPYVDVAGFDVYDRQSVGLSGTLSPPYKQMYATAPLKPMVVGETGSMPDPPASQEHQATYLDGNARFTLGNQFPDIIGIDYFDAEGMIDWSLDQGGLDALKAFVNS